MLQYKLVYHIICPDEKTHFVCDVQSYLSWHSGDGRPEI